MGHSRSTPVTNSFPYAKANVTSSTPAEPLGDPTYRLQVCLVPNLHKHTLETFGQQPLPDVEVITGCRGH